MTDVDILRAAENIIRAAYAGKIANVSGPHTQHEAEVFRDTVTGLVWARADLMIAAMQDDAGPERCSRCGMLGHGAVVCVNGRLTTTRL